MKRSAAPPRYFSLSTNLVDALDARAKSVAAAGAWLLDARNEDGTWGGPDAVDQFISTNHAAQSLLSLGLAPDSGAVSPALAFLAGVDPDKQVSFFWRAGTFLNIPAYRDIVLHDIEYIWRYRGRIGVHKDYPVPFFLLKLLRFAREPGPSSVPIKDVVKWVLAEWTDDECWYARTSITSMAAALLVDLPFQNKKRVLQRSIEFLADSFQDIDNHTGQFSGNILEDAFLIFNLCERDLLATPVFAPLRTKVEKTAARLTQAFSTGGYLESPPPFGGSVGPRVYPTAVGIRALMAYGCCVVPEMPVQTAAAVLDEWYRNYKNRPGPPAFTPFWGELVADREEDVCFVLMPFSPSKLTEIYRRYIEKPLAELGVRCRRADDIRESREIMKDVWRNINSARLIIADLTNRNPNVYYELGLAHALGKHVVLIAQDTKELGFDVSGIRTIRYDDGPAGYEALAKEVVEYVKTALGR